MANFISPSSSRDDDFSLDLIKSFERLLNDRLRSVEEREKALEQRERALAQQTPAMVATPSNPHHSNDDATDPDPNDVLHLNIGGNTNVAVLRRTLTMMEGSLLASKFSGRWQVERDRDGNIFVDQPPHLFLPLLHFLRNKACETPSTTRAKPPPPTQDFCRMVEYYHLTLAVYQMELVPLTGNYDCIAIDNFPSFRVTTTEFCTFDLMPVRHNRAVRSFQVTLGRSVTAAQIGWRRDSTLSSRDSTRLLLEGAYDQRGIGDVENTIGLDCIQCGILNDGGFTRMRLKQQACSNTNGDDAAVRTIGQGSVICCVNGPEKLELYVNGEKIDLGLLALKTSGRNIPCFSLHGELRVTSIVFCEPPDDEA
jgi:hypothetical protein